MTAYLRACLAPYYQLLTAANGKEGVDMALDRIPDIIISDVMMPEMDGFEVCEKLKTDRRTSHVPIVLLTAKATVEDRIAGLSHGADAYLAKPFHREELLVRLEKLIALRKSLQERYSKGLDVKAEPAATPEQAFLQQLADIVLANLDDEAFTVPQLCKAIGLGRTQLHRKVTALTGRSTSHFVRTIRLREAKHLLETTGLNISEVAYRTGFKHPNNFSTAFKEHFGRLPSEVR